MNFALSGCLLLIVSNAYGVFDTVSLETGSALSQTVIQVRQGANHNTDLVVISVRNETKRDIKIYSGESRYQTLLLNQELPDDVIFIDAGEWRSERILIYFTADSAYAVDPVSGKRRKLMSVESIYRGAIYARVPMIDLFRDINGDGLSDFVVPTFEGYDVAIQHPDGEFSETVSLPAKPLVDMSYNNNPWYQASALLNADMNNDGRDDIVFWRAGEFSIHRQLSNGEYSAEPYVMASSVPFEFDSIGGVSVSLGTEDQSDVLVTVLLDVKDLNGDAIPDLIIQSVKSEGVLNKKTTTSYYPGYLGDDGWVTFETTARSSIVSKGFQYRLELRDLNRDKRADVVVSSVEIGVGKIIRALLTSSMRFDLKFFPLDKEGRFSDKPAHTQPIEAKFSLSSGEVFMPFVLLSDVDGDQIEDLLVQAGDDKLMIYLGGDGSRIFSKNAIYIAAEMPQDPDNVFRTKLNQDDIWDVILKIPPPIADNQAPHKVVLLISQQPK